jgi:hypothetical protein
LFYSYTGSEHKKYSLHPLLALFCYTIKLQVSLLLLPLSIYPKKRFGCSKKREKREEKRERE